MGSERKNRRLGGISSTRARIMDVAEAHLGEGGYLGVSLEEVAREVGVSKPAPYYHLPEGKEELFVAIAHRALEQHGEGLERAIASAENGAGRLRAIARWLMSERARGHPIDELRNVGNFMNDQHRAELAEGFYGSLYAPIHRVIASAAEYGEFRASGPGFLTWGFLSLLSGMLEVKTGPSGLPLPEAARNDETMAEAVVELFFNGVVA